ncbi:MAG: hypothetical protein AUG44_09065 [Actinobacteria bacterium 13_1_20CM_3_71_11]|nr:MAG: hypothetical protein AUG44_09065 [Actinobacteria bacterium 13_1_20CM_3_71_11]
MKTVASDDRAAQRRRRRLANEIKESLRDLRIQLALLNHQVGNQLDLKDVDLDCLDLVFRHGPLSPTALARRARDRGGELLRHYAGMNGAMDRLCAGYADGELELLADFLRRTTEAGRAATDELAGD